MNRPIFICIPARYSSTRLPGKPLATIHNKEMVLHVLDVASVVTRHVLVATDDERIRNAVQNYGGKAILTGNHLSGTSRCFEALRNSGFEIPNESIIINLQGDEPFVPPTLIKNLAQMFDDPEVEIATVVHPSSDQTTIQNPNRVKAVVGENQRILYFSRSPIPHSAEVTYLHVGMYAFKWEVFQEIQKLEVSKLEQTEKLEQLTWLANGYSIHALVSEYDGRGIDTEEDLEWANLISYRQ